MSEVTANARLYVSLDDQEGVDGTVTFNTESGAMVLSQSAMFVAVDGQDAFQQAVKDFYEFEEFFPDSDEQLTLVYGGTEALGYLRMDVMQPIEAPAEMGIAVMADLQDHTSFISWSGFTLEPTAPEVKSAGAPCAIGLRHAALEGAIVNLEDRIAALESAGSDVPTSEHKMKLGSAQCSQVYVAAHFIGRVTHVYEASSKTKRPVTATVIDEPVDVEWTDFGNTGQVQEYTHEIGYFYTDTGSPQSIGTRTRVDATVMGVIYARADFSLDEDRDLYPYAIVPVTLVYGDGNDSWYNMQNYPYLRSNTDIAVKIGESQYDAYVQFSWPEKMFLSTDYEGMHLDTCRGGSTGSELQPMIQFLSMDVASADEVQVDDIVEIDLITGSNSFDLVANLNYRLVVDARFPLQADDGRYGSNASSGNEESDGLMH